MHKIILTVIGAAIMFGCSTTNKEILSRSETLESKPVLETKIQKKETPVWVSMGSGVSFQTTMSQKMRFLVWGRKNI